MILLNGDGSIQYRPPTAVEGATLRLAILTVDHQMWEVEYAQTRLPPCHRETLWVEVNRRRAPDPPLHVDTLPEEATWPHS